MSTTSAETSPTVSDSDPSNYCTLKSLLTDPKYDRATRLLRLQGWRGDDLDAAIQAGSIGQRIGPATCAVLAWVVAFTGSVPIAVIALVSAVIGVLAPNHPAESTYNMITRRFGGTPIPPNRAAKRLGCFIGTIFFTAASTALVLDYATAGQIIAGVLAGVATFVAVTNVCIPSMIYTLVFGVRRAVGPNLTVTNR